ncbi:MAG: glycosyltransferase family 4 protein [Bacteroidaceae bacterium]|nr:glycosyltransferase family 4 protein [Bacteroidaceae bacterium]
MSLNIFCKGLLRELTDEGYDVVAVSSPDSDLKELGEREGVKTVGVAMERRMSPLKDLVSLIRLIRVFRREKPDMVHSMTPKAGLLCMMAAKMTNVPIRVHTFTGLVWPTATGLMRTVLMMTDKMTCACATHVVPEGEGVKQDLERCITRKPLKVLGYGNVKGVDLEYWKRSRAMDESGQLTFVFVGRLVREKGINELVSAFVRLNGQYVNTRLLLVGPYEERLDPVLPETKRLIDECEAIEAVGSQKDVRPFYEESHVLVFPSYREGFPNVVIEAGAMDLPSIVTDINGSREIIVHQENGVIVPPRNEAALYEAMERMLTHPEERLRMGQKARKMVADRYEQGFVRQCLKDYYKELLKEGEMMRCNRKRNDTDASFGAMEAPDEYLRRGTDVVTSLD